MAIISVREFCSQSRHWALLGIAGLVFGCVPATITRLHAALTGSGPIPSSPREVDGGAASAAGGTAPSDFTKFGEVSRTEAQASAPVVQDRSLIYAVGPQTFRIGARDDEVWDLVLDLLLKNYALTVVDRPSGVISTEWDTYRKGPTIYRNKVTLRVRRAGRNAADLTVQNSLERLRDGRDTASLLGPLWLPEDRTQQAQEETRRIVHNLALVLGSAPPVFSPVWKEEPKLSKETSKTAQDFSEKEYK